MLYFLPDSRDGVLGGHSDTINVVFSVQYWSRSVAPFQLVVVTESQLYLNSPDKVVEFAEKVFGGNNLMELILND